MYILNLYKYIFILRELGLLSLEKDPGRPHSGLSTYKRKDSLAESIVKE